jgi:histidyl-tRNA synthetase
MNLALWRKRLSEYIQAIRGMNDILPAQAKIWRTIESTIVQCLSLYGYHEIRLPFLENTQLFKRSIGEVTDIVEKEMYTFNDLNGESISLRPEGTAGCVRAGLQHGLFHNQQQKLWYLGPMFRHEKPQKGRYRQFNQLGIEAYGYAGFGIELEMLALSYRLWQKLDLASSIQLKINTLGDLEERQVYRELLVAYCRENYDQLDEDSKRRLEKNPLRILDSKNPAMQDLIKAAPRLNQCLGESSQAHFDSLCAGLKALEIPYIIDPFLVRGLDYYSHTVFEWTTDELGSQGTVCAGGRYDKLIEQLGGGTTSAVGFAIGLDRLVLLKEAAALENAVATNAQIFVIVDGEHAVTQALTISEFLRSRFNCNIVINFGGGSFKSQFKKADKSGAKLALIFGEQELIDKTVSIKNLRETGEQITVPQHEIEPILTQYLQ